MTVGRRDFFRLLGVGGGAAAFGAAAATGGGSRAGTDAKSGAEADHAPQGAPGLYAGRVDPPLGLNRYSLDSRLRPPPADDRPPGAERAVELVVSETSLQVAHRTYVDAWTYNGGVPGPVLRAKEGDRLKVRLRNPTAHAHSVHFHGRHAPGEDGWQPVPPGAEHTYEVSAEPFGLHPYHCHTLPLDEHMARGLHGVLIVDPPGGRAPAHEVVLVLSGWDLDGDGRNELYAWNGIASFHRRFPIRVPVGELVRLYLVNMVEHEPLASFHIHAQTFDVYPSGTCLEPTAHTDVIALCQGERAIVEFRLPSRGRYMFHPHQSHMAARGAMGWFVAI